MSGGSFNYICFKETIDELSGYDEDIIAMSNALHALGYAWPAVETERILAIIERANEEVRMILEDKKLAQLWKAVEWYHSGDWEREVVSRAFTDFVKSSRGAKK
jgi:hypothetical protein